MKTLSIIMFLFLIGSGAAFAGTSDHKHAGHTMSPEMKKQHEVMVTIVKQWKACKNALKDNNFKDAELAVETIIEAAADIESFRLHKNADKHEQFAEQCNTFRERMVRLNEAIKNGDADNARKLSTAAEENCRQCHTMFR